ncbi:MAG: SeqA protein [Alteromonas sp.]|nr:SeqA protein [Alteromonas sp.]OUX91512.1 MAG: SeqA protein [Alteromonas sp. TMED35]
MKSIEIDDDLYAFIASQTKHIGESASQILRRLLLPEDGEVIHAAKTASDAPDLTVVSTSDKPVGGASTNSPVTPDSSASKEGESQQTNANHSEEKTSPVAASRSAALSNSAAQKNNSAQSNIAAKAKPSVKAAAKPAVSKAPASKVTAVKTAENKQASSTSQNQSAAGASADALSHDKNDILDLVSTSALSTFTKRVDQFLFVLSAAHKLNADSFERVESIKGKNRTYFATSKEALLENGSSTNPKAIPDSAYWVVTNNNTAKKVSMLEQVLRQLGYTPEVIASVVARFSSEGK